MDADDASQGSDDQKLETRVTPKARWMQMTAVSCVWCHDITISS